MFGVNMTNNVEDVDDEEDRKAPIIIALVVLFLLIVAGIAYFSVTSISPPKNLQAVVEGNNVVLLWDPSDTEGVVGYNVYRSNEEGVLGELLNKDPIEETTYIDSGLEEGTYYYIVRTVVEDGREDSNMDQVKAVIGNAPYGLSMVLGNGDGFSNTNYVKAIIKANNADECRFTVDQNPQEWFSYVEETTVYVDEGTHVVSLQCRNEGGLSEEITQEITVDTKPPILSFSVLSLDGKHLTISLKAEDDGVLDCTALAGDVVVDSFTMLPGTVEKSFDLISGKYDFTIKCTDEAGNEGTASYPLDIKEEEKEKAETFDFSVMIEGGKEEVTSRLVNVEVIGTGIEACRYTNENFYPEYKTPWSEYKRNKAWTLSPGEGLKTVYVQCVDKEGDILEKYDTVLYQKNGGKKDNNPKPPQNNTNQTNQTNATIHSIKYYSVKDGVDYEMKDGEEINVKEVKAVVYVEGAVYCDYVDEFNGNKNVIGTSVADTEPITISGELYDSEGEHSLYVVCYDSQGLPDTSAAITIFYNKQVSLSPVAKSVNIIGYVLRDGKLVEDQQVTALSKVKVSVTSENADEGKLWNTPYVDPVCGQVNVPGVIDSEEEATWDSSLTNNVVSFDLIPKTYAGCPADIPPGSDMPIKLVPVNDGIREVNFKVRNENEESAVISDTIFYDATPPTLNDVKPEVVSYSDPAGVYNGFAVKFSLDAVDNGETYGYGPYRLVMLRYVCKQDSVKSSKYCTNSISCTGCKFDKKIDVPYSDNYFDYPVVNGYTYKYVVNVLDYAGHPSNSETIYVTIPTNNSNNTNTTGFENVTFYYKKGDDYLPLEEGMAINSRNLRAYIYGSGFGLCKFIDTVNGVSVLIGSQQYSTTPTVIDGEIPSYPGEHSVYVVCETKNGQEVSDSVEFYYDNVNPRVAAYARPHYHYNRHNNTYLYKIKLHVKAKDNHNLNYLEANYSIISVNLTCLRDRNYSITTRPYFIKPFRFRRIFDCINIERDIPFVKENISGKSYRASYLLTDVNLSTNNIIYVYVFSVYVEDEATNPAFTYSNPVISHVICYLNSENDDFNFCYMPEKYRDALLVCTKKR